MVGAVWGKLATVANGAWRRVVELIQPPACVVCHDPLEALGRDVWLCPTCQATLGGEPVPRCLRCGARIGLPAQGEVPCLRCRGERFHFDGVEPLAGYEEAVRSAVLRMKRWSGEPLAIALGRLLAARQADAWLARGIDAVVPVPMHWSRRLWRATNSPDLLATQLARRLKVPAETNVLYRTRRTELQSQIAPSARAANVRDAFRLRRGVSALGLRLLVVDDILTTGATTSEVARILKQAGAEAVFVSVVARAGDPA